MIDLPPSVEVIEGHDFAGSTEAVRHALFDVATKGMGILDNIATSRQLLEMFSNFSDIRRKKYSVKLLQASEEVPDNVKQLAAMIDSFMTIEATDHEFVRRQPDSGLGWHLDNSLITPGLRLLAHLKGEPATLLATKKNHGNRDLISEDPFESLRLNREVYAAHYAVGRVIILPQSFYSPLYIMLNEQEAEKIEHPLHTGLHEVDKQRPREILVWDVHYSYAAALNNLQIEDPEQVRAAER